jgi:hypothetical protein
MVARITLWSFTALVAPTVTARCRARPPSARRGDDVVTTADAVLVLSPLARAVRTAKKFRRPCCTRRARHSCPPPVRARAHGGRKAVSSQFVRIAVLLGLVARQRHQPGLGFRRDRRLRPRSVIECRKCAIAQRPLDAALHRLMMHPEFFPDRAKTMVSPGRRAAFARAPPGSPARCASAKCPSIVQYPHRSSPIRTACRHPAITPILVQPIANEESTNRPRVPLRLVSWNRSSRSSRRRGLAPKSKMLAHISKTELEVIRMTVAVAVSHAMFSARFDGVR